MIRDEFEEEIGVAELNESSYTNSQNKQQPMFELTLSQAKQVWDKKKKKFVDKIGKIKPIGKYSNQEKPNDLYFELKEFQKNAFASNQIFTTPRGREALLLLLGLKK